MAKDRSGYVFLDKKTGVWFARTTLSDTQGKRRNIKRSAKSKSDAKEILKQLLRQLDDEGAVVIEATQLTFNHLADFYAKHYLQPAVYRDGRKVSGLRAVDRAKSVLVSFRAYFGNKKLRAVTYGDVRGYKQMRMQTETQYKRPPTIGTLNRELVVLRRILNIAVQQGWLLKNPFNCGDALISPADERRRERILTLEEEKLLLSACEHPLRQHLIPFLIAALDTGCRRGELLKLEWNSDVV